MRHFFARYRFAAMALSFAASLWVAAVPLHAAPSVSDVINTYADIAQAGYEDSLATAKQLQQEVNGFLEKPTEENMGKAREAWLAARVPYQQTEAYRFGNAIVDEWEGKVNAWPLDEGLIDYVSRDYGTESDENELYAVNIIAKRKIKIDGIETDVSNITKKLIAGILHEAGGIEANVASGYHAVEFLLWGQDLSGAERGPGARPATDFDADKCTGGNCDRRAQYLKAVTGLLLDDLTWMAAQWGAEGAARRALTEVPQEQALIAIFTGLGSLSYGELAGERMKLGLLIHDPEEEHDCFSDNTHNSHFYNALGIQNVYTGRYKRIDGTLIKGTGVSDLVREKSPETDARLRKALDETMRRMAVLVSRAQSLESYDQMIGEGNAKGNAVVQAAIDALLAQTREIERSIAVLKLEAIQFEGSDSLDDVSKVK